MAEETRGKNENNNGTEHNDTTLFEVDYDQLLKAAGEFGPYQMYLLLFTSPFYIFGSFAHFSQIFLTEVSPNHWCWIPELKNLTLLERKTLSIPLDNDEQFGYSRCSSYVANWSEVLSTGQKPNKSWSTQPCLHGWEFNKSEIPYPTISSELGWVCDKSSYPATAQSLFFIGSIIGGFLVGWIADRFGRLPAAVSANMIGCIAGVASIFARNFTEFAICRIFTGMSHDNCMIMTYLLVLEYTGPKYRTRMANVSFAIFFTIGLSALPWIALACGDWKVLSLATSLPLAMSLLAPFFIPESSRWLLSKGRVDDAVKQILIIGRKNKKVVPLTTIKQFKSSLSKNVEVTGNLLDLLRRPLLRRIFVCMCLQFLFTTMIYDSLIRTVGSLQFDFFLSFLITSLTEFPSLLLLSFTLDLTGRQWLSFFLLMICGIFSSITPFVSGGVPSVLCALLARICINIVYGCAMQWTTEIMPTSVRGSATSIVHICGHIATVISPFIAYLEIYKTWLPLVIIGIVSVFTGILCLSLPETANIAMPQTFDDAESLVRSQKLWDVPCLKKETRGRTGHVNDSFELN